MSYEARCECGAVHPVGPSDAGAPLKCGCGRTFDVPPLHQLRAATSLGTVSDGFRYEGVLMRLSEGLRKGTLPGTRRCCTCGAETDGLVHVSVVCARGPTDHDPAAENDDAQARLAGCALGPFGYLVSALLRPKAAPPGGSREVAFDAPLRACPACAPALTDAGTLRQAMRTVPEYAAVLNLFPKATVARRGPS